MLNRYGKWTVHGFGNDKSYSFETPGYAIYGTIFLKDTKWKWEARVVLGCRYDTSSDPICGYAPTLESAKRIVETLCYETGTCVKQPDIEKDDLYYMIISFVDWCISSGNITTPANKEKVLDLFGEKGVKKLKEMIFTGVILEAMNGMLSLPNWFLSGKKNPHDE